MTIPRIAIAGLAATALVTLTPVVAGCGSDSSTSKSSSSSSAATSATKSASSSSGQASSDYGSLLIKASDINAPGQTFTAGAPILNPNGQEGVAVAFTNADSTEVIGDTILVLPDASTAAAALESAKAAMGSSVVGGTAESSPVGTGGTVMAGTSPDGTKSVTVLMFTQGRAFATLEFDGAPDDPVPPEGVLDVGGKQADAIKSGLPG